MVDEGEELEQTVLTPAENQGVGESSQPGDLQLVVIGNGSFTSHPLPEAATITIGRSPSCDIALEDESISRRHAILHVGQAVTIEDLGSANGTMVRGTKVAPARPTAITVGELVGLGSVSVMLQRQARQASPARTRVAKATVRGTDIVVSDAQMQSLHRLLEQVAASNLGVLLLGETGAGKEVFARALHRASPRAAGPFVEINCAALTESLFEAELFGHEKGAFTHAHAAKPGLIETAHGGTLLLDEIGDMPLTIQVKLLRFLEDSQVRRVGGLKARAVDVRVVAATNSDLEAQIARGGFRSDLYYRLNGITLVIPPLRERRAELEPMARAFIERSWTRHDAPPPALAPATLELMRSYGWPGNVRELKHVIERAVLLCGDGPILPAHLRVEQIRATLATDEPQRVSRPRREDEQQRILQALDRAGGNQTRAARLLGISRRTLVNRLNEYEIDRPRKARPKPPDH